MRGSRVARSHPGLRRLDNLLLGGCLTRWGAREPGKVRANPSGVRGQPASVQARPIIPMRRSGLKPEPPRRSEKPSIMGVVPEQGRCGFHLGVEVSRVWWGVSCVKCMRP